MLGESEVIFERNHFIADILKKETVLDSFNVIEFENFKIFFDIMKMNIIKPNKNLKIRIEDEKEFDILSELMIDTGLANFYNIIVIMDEILFLELVKTKLPKISHIKLRVYLSKISFDQKDLVEDENARKWINKNPVFYDVVINYENYIDVLSEIPYLYCNRMIRFFNISWDYQSFEEMTISEFQLLEFWINHISIWKNFARDKKFQNIEIEGISNFFLPIFISADGNLFYNKKHFEEEGIPLFNILEENKRYPYLDMAKILKYSKLTPDLFHFPFNPKKVMWNMIDYYDNMKLMGNVNEIPYITSIIMEWSWRI